MTDEADNDYLARAHNRARDEARRRRRWEWGMLSLALLLAAAAGYLGYLIGDLP